MSKALDTEYRRRDTIARALWSVTILLLVTNAINLLWLDLMFMGLWLVMIVTFVAGLWYHHSAKQVGRVR